jgi:hypothetical protein
MTQIYLKNIAVRFPHCASLADWLAERTTLACAAQR